MKAWASFPRWATVALLCLGAFVLRAHAAPGDLDLSFDPGAALQGGPKVAAAQPDGKIVVAGSFGIARLYRIQPNPPTS